MITKRDFILLDSCFYENSFYVTILHSRYANVTIGKYAEHMSEKPAKANQVAEAERRAAQKKIIGGPFKLNMHPRATFTDNPFKLDKPLPAVRKPSEKTIPINTPFKPSSPSKKVSTSCELLKICLHNSSSIIEITNLDYLL